MYGGDGVKLDCPASLLKGSIATHPWWQAYHSLPEKITVTGCMAHARRRFDEALTVLKKDFTKEQLKETTVYSIAETAMLNGLFTRAGRLLKAACSTDLPMAFENFLTTWIAERDER